MHKVKNVVNTRKIKLHKKFYYDERNEDLALYRKLIYVQVKLRNKMISMHHDNLTSVHFGYFLVIYDI